MVCKCERDCETVREITKLETIIVVSIIIIVMPYLVLLLYYENMVHYEQIVSRLCCQLGRFVEVVFEEIGHYDLHGQWQTPKKRTHTNNYVDNNTKVALFIIRARSARYSSLYMNGGKRLPWK